MGSIGAEEYWETVEEILRESVIQSLESGIHLSECIHEKISWSYLLNQGYEDSVLLHTENEQAYEGNTTLSGDFDEIKQTVAFFALEADVMQYGIENLDLVEVEWEGIHPDDKEFEVDYDTAMGKGEDPDEALDNAVSEVYSRWRNRHNGDTLERLLEDDLEIPEVTDPEFEAIAYEGFSHFVSIRIKRL